MMCKVNKTEQGLICHRQRLIMVNFYREVIVAIPFCVRSQNCVVSGLIVFLVLFYFHLLFNYVFVPCFARRLSCYCIFYPFGCCKFVFLGKWKNEITVITFGKTGGANLALENVIFHAPNSSLFFEVHCVFLAVLTFK